MRREENRSFPSRLTALFLDEPINRFLQREPLTASSLSLFIAAIAYARWEHGQSLLRG
jgi:hypothetical protein